MGKALPQRKVKKSKREDSLARDEAVGPQQKLQRMSKEIHEDNANGLEVIEGQVTSE